MLNTLINKFFHHNQKKMTWYGIGAKNDFEGWSDASKKIFDIANMKGIRIDSTHHQGVRVIGVYCTKEQIEEMIALLGSDEYGYGILNPIDANYFDKQMKKSIK